MVLINPCHVFHFTVKDGTRAFCVAEMFMAVFNVTIALCEVSAIYVHPYMDDDSERIQDSIILALGALFTMSLVLQAFTSFLLYYVGYKSRNVIICWIWMCIAAFNMACPFVLYIVDDKNKDKKKFHCFLFYTIYVVYGIWVVFTFTLWTKRENEDQDHTTHRPRVTSTSGQIAVSQTYNGSNINPSTQSARQPPRGTRTIAGTHY